VNERIAQPRGVFLGLLTLDIEYLVEAPPARDEKVVAKRQLVAAGGPATNAAKTFAVLGGCATLATAVGAGPVAVADLVTQHGVELQDLAGGHRPPLPVSSIVVVEDSGERSVVSVVDSGASLPRERAELVDLSGADCLLLDGCHLDVAVPVAERARAQGISVVLDAGSWKEGLERLLPLVDWAVCSERFAPPDGSPPLALDVRGVAVTCGPRPVRWREGDRSGDIEVGSGRPAVDTLGAGDVFHGAFCLALAQGLAFAEALGFAAEHASASCAHFGVDAWLRSCRS
jgi:sugar/nucleoside kinase (ribokinase family)